MYVVLGKVMFPQGERRVSPGTTDLIPPGQVGKREVMVGAWAIQSHQSPPPGTPLPLKDQVGRSSERTSQEEWPTHASLIWSIMISKSRMMRMGYGQFCLVMLMGDCLVFILLSVCLSEKKISWEFFDIVQIKLVDIQTLYFDIHLFLSNLEQQQ